MRLTAFRILNSSNFEDSWGLAHNGKVLDIKKVCEAENFGKSPVSVGHYMYMIEEFEPKLRTADKKFKEGAYEEFSYDESKVQLLAPIEQPNVCRDGYAFRQHVFTARRNRGVPMIDEFDRYPVFYFTNHMSIAGSGDLVFMPDHFDKLDFELEACAVIGKWGKNIKAKEADEYIYGYMIMNDWSARTLQMEEMLLNLGPAKGKDFCTSVGPYLVTKDELADRVQAPPTGHIGMRHNLKMVARLNGKQISEGNLGDMDWTFAELIERMSYGVKISPTEIIGSGTVGTGCLLELNGTAKLENPDYQPVWIQPGDVMELEIEGLGILKNKVHRNDTDHSLLKNKHSGA